LVHPQDYFWGAASSVFWRLYTSSRFVCFGSPTAESLNRIEVLLKHDWSK
jgi:hypothetical protein